MRGSRSSAVTTNQSIKKAGFEPAFLSPSHQVDGRLKTAFRKYDFDTVNVPARTFSRLTFTTDSDHLLCLA